MNINYDWAGVRELTVHGPTIAFQLDASGRCIAARFSDHHGTTMMDPMLFEGIECDAAV